MRTYELVARGGIEIEGAVTWAFLFEGFPYFEGFRDLATNGIDKAVLNAFRMLGMLGGSWLEATSSHALSLDGGHGERRARKRPTSTSSRPGTMAASAFCSGTTMTTTFPGPPPR